MRLVNCLKKCLICFTAIPALAYAEMHGKIDGGIVGLNVTLLEHGHKVKTLSMIGISSNATILVCDGWCIKPKVVVASGDGDLWNLGSGIGYFLPVSDYLNITPNVGVAYSSIETHRDLPGLPDADEIYNAWNPWVGFDIGVNLTPVWTVSLMYQYAWSSCKTQIGPFRSKTESRGSNYAVQTDYYFRNDWSVNLAVGSYDSQSKELHGTKTKGIRLGVGYFF